MISLRIVLSFLVLPSSSPRPRNDLHPRGAPYLENSRICFPFCGIFGCLPRYGRWGAVVSQTVPKTTEGDVGAQGIDPGERASEARGGTPLRDPRLPT